MLRIAIIGNGPVARCHLEACRQVSGIAVLLGGRLAPDSGTAGDQWPSVQRPAHRSPAHQWQADLQAALLREDIDAIDVCVSGALQSEVILAAAGAGKHVLAERLEQTSLVAASRLIEACRRGDEIMHHAAYGTGCVRYVMGQEAVSVYAVAGSHFNRLHQVTGIEDLATISLEMAGGGVATVVVGRAPNPSMLSVADDYVRVLGTREMVTARWESPAFLLSDAQAKASRRVGAGAGSTALVIDQFIAAILNGERPALDHHDGLAELRVMLAAYESLRTRAPVRLG